MLPTLKSLFHRPAIRMGMINGGTLQGSTRLRNAQFVSFMSTSIHPFHTDRYDTRLRRRKHVKALLSLALLAGIAWVVIESASALSMF